MARTKVRGGLNLVQNLYEMNGWETKSDFSINQWQSLDPFSLATSRGCPVELPSGGTSIRSSHPGGNFLMSGIRVYATDQGRFFTFKNPEQAPNFEVFLQNRLYLLKFYSRTGSFFDNLVSNAQLKRQNPSCFHLLFSAA